MAAMLRGRSPRSASFGASQEFDQPFDRTVDTSATIHSIPRPSIHLNFADIEDCLSNFLSVEEQLVAARSSLAALCGTSMETAVSESPLTPLSPFSSRHTDDKLSKNPSSRSLKEGVEPLSAEWRLKNPGEHMDFVARNIFTNSTEYPAEEETTRRCLLPGASGALLGWESGLDENSAFTTKRVGCLWMLILHPEAKLRLLWIAPAFLFILAEAFLVPFLLCFSVKPDPSGPLGISLRIIDLYFIIDIFITFFTGYRDRNGCLVNAPGRIARHYIRGWLLLDATAAIPWSWIGEGEQFQALTRSLKVLRLLRMARLLRLAKMRQLIEAAETFLEGDYSAELVLGFGKVVLLLCAVTHWGACVWHAAGEEDGGWVAETAKVFGVSSPDIETRYTWSLYFTLTTLTTVGYGDVTPGTTRECQYVLGLLLTSAVVFSGLLGMLSDLVAGINKEARVVGHKKRLLARYMTWRQVPRHLMLKVRNHLLFVWGMQKDYDLYEEELKRLLTPTLRAELCYHVFKDSLKTIPCLGWMHGYQACCKFLADSVKSTFFDSADFIFRAGEENKDVILVLGGTVLLYRRDGDAVTDAVGPEEPDPVQAAWAAWDTVINNDSPKTSRRPTWPTWPTLSKRMRRMFSLRGSKHSLKLSALEDGGSPFCGPCFSEVLHSAAFQLKVKDREHRDAAVVIQRAWKGYLRGVRRSHSYKLSNGSGSNHPKGNQVHSPAYFGESCLWAPFNTWRTQVPCFTYTLRCKTRVEVIFIPRLAVGNCIERFSPWLRERFETFRESVIASRQSHCDVYSRQVSQKQSGTFKGAASNGKEVSQSSSCQNLSRARAATSKKQTSL
eukprot:TRINITY_DN36564_c0_g1_i1.p1 TRINITY_DN36564_c0_g1~~TRINITY_DN36564_c0_g1_i1.p1  ORF type:complete len:839 (-),score=146.86 TRINITY_DN36564_c0_g1_i1:84-2600(-)